MKTIVDVSGKLEGVTRNKFFGTVKCAMVVDIETTRNLYHENEMQKSHHSPQRKPQKRQNSKRK